jgi:hypothetical protein
LPLRTSGDPELQHSDPFRTRLDQIATVQRADPRRGAGQHHIPRCKVKKVVIVDSRRGMLCSICAVLPSCRTLPLTFRVKRRLWFKVVKRR